MRLSFWDIVTAAQNGVAWLQPMTLTACPVGKDIFGWMGEIFENGKDRVDVELNRPNMSW